MLVSGDRDGNLTFWDLNQEKFFRNNSIHYEGVNCLKFMQVSNQTVLASGGLRDNKFTITDLWTEEKLLER